MRPLDLLLYASVVFAWATSWYPLSLQMGVVAAEVSLVWRFAIAATMMFAISRWRGVALRHGRDEHLRFAVLGVFLFSTNFYNASLFAASGLLASDPVDILADQCADGGRAEQITPAANATRRPGDRTGRVEADLRT